MPASGVMIQISIAYSIRDSDGDALCDKYRDFNLSHSIVSGVQRVCPAIGSLVQPDLFKSQVVTVSIPIYCVEAFECQAG